jgi:hypothetical protein
MLFARVCFFSSRHGTSAIDDDLSRSGRDGSGEAEALPGRAFRSSGPEETGRFEVLERAKADRTTSKRMERAR